MHPEVVHAPLDPAQAAALRRHYLDVSVALCSGAAPAARSVDGLREASVDTALADLVTELPDRLGLGTVGEVARWLLAWPSSADLFHEQALAGFASVRRRLAADEPVPAWLWSWFAEGCVVAFEVTGQERFVRAVVDSFGELLEHRDDRRGRVDVVRGRALRSWGVPATWWAEHNRGDFGRGWTASVDTAGRIAYPVLRLARLVAAEGRTFEADPDTAAFVPACIASLREFDPDLLEVPGVGGMYRRLALDDIEPLNHSLVAGRALLEVASLTGDVRAREQAASLARFFRWSLRLDRGGGYVWPYRPLPGEPAPRQPERGPKPNRSWKADVDASYALACHEHGVEFSGRDLDRFVRTFTRGVVLPNGQLNSFIVPWRVAPLLAPTATPTERVRAPGVATWNLLGRWDPTIHRVVDAAVAAHPAVFPRGWLTSPRTTYAYAERLLVTGRAVTRRGGGRLGRAWHARRWGSGGGASR